MSFPNLSSYSHRDSTPIFVIICGGTKFKNKNGKREFEKKKS
jgi:hypothetical protein